MLTILSRYVYTHGYTACRGTHNNQVEAKNLEAYTTYYYQFSVCDSDNKSPVGRTKTTPKADDDITKVALAIYSCSNYPFGFFNAYGNTVRKVSIVALCKMSTHISTGLC
jgi:alkaline phosphatase D